MKKLLIGCLGLFVLAIVGAGCLVVFAAMQGPQQTVTSGATPAASVAAANPTDAAKSTEATKPTAPTPKPAAKAEEKAATVAKIGDRVESGGVALTVNGVSRAESLSQFMTAKPGRMFAVADVTIETTGREKAPYNPLYFKVKDSAGFEYNGSLIGADNSLKSGELEQGGKVRGTVAFDVPNEAKGLVLSYQPAVIFGGYQTIRVALE